MNIQQAQQQVVKQIKPKGKYTILKFNDFGFPVVVHTTIEQAYISNYAQYDHVLIIHHKPKRKRAIYKQWLLPDNIHIIWEGWLDISIDDFWRTEQNNGVTVRISRMSFDRSYIIKKLEQIDVKPLAILDRDYYTDISKLEFIYQIVTENGSEFLTFEKLKEKYTFSGYCNYGRIELRNQPHIVGLVGPMFNGYMDGKAIIRYETQKVYNILSV